MRATAVSFTLFLLALPAAADTHAEIVDLFASMTAALTEEVPNVAAFMKAVDRNMDGREELNRNLDGLVRNWDVASSVDFLKDEGGEAKRSVDLDWYLELRSRVPDGPTVRRREIVHCEIARQNKRWRILSLKPVSLFTP